MEIELIQKSGIENWLKNMTKRRGNVGVSLSFDDPGCRRNAETMSMGYQLPEEHLERSPGLRFSGNKPPWQKIPNSKQRQTRGRPLIKVIFVAEPKN